MSLGDKLRAGLRQAGREVRRLKQKGELKLSQLEAESELRNRHVDLGRLIAARLIDAGDRTVSMGDPAIEFAIDAVRRARLLMAEVEEQRLGDSAESQAPEVESGDAAQGDVECGPEQ